MATKYQKLAVDYKQEVQQIKSLEAQVKSLEAQADFAEVVKLQNQANELRQSLLEDIQAEYHETPFKASRRAGVEGFLRVTGLL